MYGTCLEGARPILFGLCRNLAALPADQKSAASIQNIAKLVARLTQEVTTGALVWYTL